MTIEERTEYAVFAKRPGSRQFRKYSATFYSEELTRKRIALHRTQATEAGRDWDFTMRSRKVRIERGEWR